MLKFVNIIILMTSLSNLMLTKIPAIWYGLIIRSNIVSLPHHRVLLIGIDCALVKSCDEAERLSEMHEFITFNCVILSVFPLHTIDCEYFMLQLYNYFAFENFAVFNFCGWQPLSYTNENYENFPIWYIVVLCYTHTYIYSRFCRPITQRQLALWAGRNTLCSAAWWRWSWQTHTRSRRPWALGRGRMGAERIRTRSSCETSRSLDRRKRPSWSMRTTWLLHLLRMLPSLRLIAICSISSHCFNQSESVTKYCLYSINKSSGGNLKDGFFYCNCMRTS